jgi:hypothetical protein
VSERRTCAALGQHRSTQRKTPRGRDDEERLTADVIELARQYGRYGYRKIAELLRRAGWEVNHKRVERIWRREGLKVPGKQPRRGRLWLADGSCIRLRAEHRNHVWSYDFVEDRTHEGRKYRKLGIDVGQTSFAKYMARGRRGPSQGWRTFLRNHADGIASIDLFVVPAPSFRPLYGMLVLRHERRRLMWLTATINPTAE